jgi:hypothetical protein
MSDISSERIEPTPRVVEPQGPERRGQPESGSRRRPPPAPAASGTEDDPEAPVHQVDRLV